MHRFSVIRFVALEQILFDTLQFEFPTNENKQTGISNAIPSAVPGDATGNESIRRSASSSVGDCRQTKSDFDSN